jgi:hypothetical protein
VIEGALLERFNEATEHQHLDTLAARLEAAVARLASGRPVREAELRQQIETARTEAARLVEFIAAGRSPAMVREKLTEMERKIEEAEAELAALPKAPHERCPPYTPNGCAAT